VCSCAGGNACCNRNETVTMPTNVDPTTPLSISTSAALDNVTDTPGCTGRFCTCSFDCLTMSVTLPDVIVSTAPVMASSGNTWQTAISNVAASSWLPSGWEFSINSSWMSVPGPLAPVVVARENEAFHAVLSVSAPSCAQVSVTVYFQGIVNLFWNGLEVTILRVPLRSQLFLQLLCTDVVARCGTLAYDARSFNNATASIRMASVVVPSTLMNRNGSQVTRC
jgi:hypothetical protein